VIVALPFKSDVDTILCDCVSSILWPILCFFCFTPLLHSGYILLVNVVWCDNKLLLLLQEFISMLVIILPLSWLWEDQVDDLIQLAKCLLCGFCSIISSLDLMKLPFLNAFPSPTPLWALVILVLLVQQVTETQVLKAVIWREMNGLVSPDVICPQLS